MNHDIDMLDTDVEADLRSTVAAVLKARCPTDAVAALFDGDRSIVAPIWTSIAEDLGLAGLLVPEGRGGSGGTVREAAVVMEELGRAVAPTAFLESSVIATTVLLAGESGLVQEMASGAARSTLVLPFASSSLDELPEGNASSDGRVSVTVRGVAGALDADVLLVAVQGARGVEVRAVAAQDATILPVVSLDMTRQLADVEIVDAPSTLVVDHEQGADALVAALEVGAALLASEQAGLAAWSLEMTTQYLKTRRQFGRVLGGYQALKHRLADLYVEVQSAAAAARYAAGATAESRPDRGVAVAVAASYCGDVAVHAAEESIQLLGGMGMTWEHPAHLYLKRAKADQIGLGTPDRHRDQLAALVDLAAPRSLAR